MHRLKIIILTIFPITMISQNITGKIYDSKTTVKGASIYNTTKEQINYTDENGDFEMGVNINDTLIFYSLFHNQKTLIINKTHFKDVLVVELKETINELDEILLRSMKSKSFEEKEQSVALNEQIKKDVKINPHLYRAAPKYGLDFMQIASMIGKLFKKKKTPPPSIISITYKELDSLFSNSNFFDNELLVHNLKISTEYKPLFFDYCGAQNIDNKLLLKDNQFLLLDNLVNHSREFLIVISEDNGKQVKN